MDKADFTVNLSLEKRMQMEKETKELIEKLKGNPQIRSLLEK